MAQGHIATSSIGAPFVISHSSFPSLNPQLKTLNFALASSEGLGRPRSFMDRHRGAAIREFGLCRRSKENCPALSRYVGDFTATVPDDGRTRRPHAAARG